MTNPYDSRFTATECDVAIASASATNWLLLWLLPPAGLITGAVSYIALAIVLENRNAESHPILSYGQQACLISMPLCAIMGAMIGLSVAFVVGRQAFIGAALSFITGCIGALSVNSLWSDQVSQYGRDYSEIVLFYPPMGAAMLCWLCATIAGVLAYRRRLRSK